MIKLPSASWIESAFLELTLHAPIKRGIPIALAMRWLAECKVQGPLFDEALMNLITDWCIRNLPDDSLAIGSSVNAVYVLENSTWPLVIPIAYGIPEVNVAYARSWLRTSAEVLARFTGDLSGLQAYYWLCGELIDLGPCPRHHVDPHLVSMRQHMDTASALMLTSNGMNPQITTQCAMSIECAFNALENSATEDQLAIVKSIKRHDKHNQAKRENHDLESRVSRLSKRYATLNLLPAAYYHIFNTFVDHRYKPEDFSLRQVRGAYVTMITTLAEVTRYLEHKSPSARLLMLIAEEEMYSSSPDLHRFLTLVDFRTHAIRTLID